MGGGAPTPSACALLDRQAPDGLAAPRTPDKATQPGPRYSKPPPCLRPSPLFIFGLARGKKHRGSPSRVRGHMPTLRSNGQVRRLGVPTRLSLYSTLGRRRITTQSRQSAKAQRKNCFIFSAIARPAGLSHLPPPVKNHRPAPGSLAHPQPHNPVFPHNLFHNLPAERNATWN